MLLCSLKSTEGFSLKCQGAQVETLQRSLLRAVNTSFSRPPHPRYRDPAAVGPVWSRTSLRSQTLAKTLVLLLPV